MDDSFRVRVDKIFGSLTPSQSSLWSLTDEEVEKREWNRERDDIPDREQNPCSSSFDGFLSKERKNFVKNSNKARKLLEDDVDDDIDDEEEEEETEEKIRGGCSNQAFDGDENEQDEWEIRSSIGLDCTLDNEEEEDAIDKVAVGRENTGERIYMREVNDHGRYLNSHNVVPESFKDHAKDPRANILAAKNRLKEDTETSSFDNHNNMQSPIDSQVTEEASRNLKSILKRKENQCDAKPRKRVRFDPECENKYEEELEKTQDSVMVNYSMETGTPVEYSSLLPQVTPAVPDYVRNPSKYTRYSFDTLSELDEESNRKAHMDFLDMMKRSKTEESSHTGDLSADLPKSITFIPKKKIGDDATTNKKDSEMKPNQEETTTKESLNKGGFPLGIAAVEVQENEACAMEEDEPEAVIASRSGRSQKHGRQYRSKVRSDEDVS